MKGETVRSVLTSLADANEQFSELIGALFDEGLLDREHALAALEQQRVTLKHLATLTEHLAATVTTLPLVSFEAVRANMPDIEAPDLEM